MKTKIDKLIKKFLATGEEESEKIELDNLDSARLVKEQTGTGTKVMVENEYGTQFEVSDLSNVEINIFLAVL
jgi:hypothetical protein